MALTDKFSSDRNPLPLSTDEHEEAAGVATQTLPLSARIFIGLVFVLGMLSVGAVLRMPAPQETGHPWEVGLFIALGILAGRTKIRLIPGRTVEDRGSLSLSFALIFAALIRFGPGPAMLVGGISTLSSCLYPKRKALHQIVFNLGLSAFGTFVAGEIFIRLNHGLGQSDLFTLFGAVMTSCLSFFLINTLAVAFVITLSAPQPFAPLWRTNFLWLAPSYFAAASAGTLAIIILGKQVGSVILFVTPVAALTYLAYTLSWRRTEENQQRILELQTHETQLAEDLQRETLIAETLQRSLLSAPVPDAFPGLHVYTEYEPAWNEMLVGGDFFDAVPLNNDKLALVVGDVTGKGLAAATHTAEVKYALRAILHESPDPGQALSRLNGYLIAGQRARSGQVPPLVAVALAVLDIRSGDLWIGGAGAEHPLLLRANGGTEEIYADGMLLGIDPEEVYGVAKRHLGPGDALLMVTDGLTEARHDHDFFGYAGLTRAAKQALATSSAGLMGKTIIAQAKQFAGGPLHDDVCLLYVKRDDTQAQTRQREETRALAVPL